MFDLGWTELLVIGIVALIVIGPKDLPGMFRTLGRFTAKARNMAREFQRAMDDAADQAGVKDVAKDLRDATNPRKMGLDALNDAADKFEKWQPKVSSDKAAKPAPEGSETGKLSAERAEQAEKIRTAAAEKATARRAAEEAAAKAAAEAPAAEGDSTGKSDA
ncbi:Sec-independent protein translocase protein TatB [Actibacterium sp. MT2.3-13A]|uniref:Sec-independent protein translocase protein TatB n=1 Tax=Actibacterium sp. MT2.3-13A TaxID=2828332 RepID=UPI001BA75FDF|nr:Sec-independent protein translocase protein TatB [Actibacterium sp. MT2.3-13A]